MTFQNAFRTPALDVVRLAADFALQQFEVPYTKSAVIPDDNSQYLFIGQTYYHWLPGGDCLCYSQQLYLKDERAATGDARL